MPIKIRNKSTGRVFSVSVKPKTTPIRKKYKSVKKKLA